MGDGRRPRSKGRGAQRSGDGDGAFEADSPRERPGGALNRPREVATVIVRVRITPTRRTPRPEVQVHVPVEAGVSSFAIELGAVARGKIKAKN